MTALPARLLAFATSWEAEGNAPQTVAILRVAAAALSGRVPEGDMARALEWVRQRARDGVMQDEKAVEHLPAFEEAIAAYDPERAGAVAAAADAGEFQSDTAALAFLRVIGKGNPNIERAVERLLLSLTTQQPGDGWRPIAEAPRDGTPVLAYWKPLPNWPYPPNGSNYAVAEFRDGEWRPAGDDYDTEWAAPAYWMPLPAAPSAKGVANG